MVVRRGFILAALALLAALAPSAAAQPPVEVDVSSFTPERGRVLEFWIDVTARRELAVEVSVNAYVPGKGWGGWRTLWEGRMGAGEGRRVWGSVEIPADAKAGSVVVWCQVLFLGFDDYMVLGGQRYYASYSMLYVAGALPDPAAEYWKNMSEHWESQATYWMDRANYWKGQSEYWEGEARKLREAYFALELNYTRLQRDYALLQQRCSALESEMAVVKSERDRLAGEVEFLRKAGLAAALLGLAAGVAAGAVASRLARRKQ